MVLDLASFWQTTKSRTQAIAVPLTNTRKNSNASHPGSVRHSFNNGGEQSFDVVQAPKDTGETQQRQRQRRRVRTLQRWLAAAGLFRWRATMGLFAQIAI